MRYTIFVLLGLLLLLSCNSGRGPAGIKDDPIRTMKRIFHGTWVRATATPATGITAKLGTIARLDFDKKGISGDSLLVSTSGISNPASFYVYFQWGTTDTAIPTNINDSTKAFYELGYEATNGDTTLVLIRYSANKKMDMKTRYKKVADSDAPGEQ